MRLLFIAFIFSFSTLANIQEGTLTTFDYTQKVYQSIEELSQVRPDNFLVEVSKIRKVIDKYIEHKKGVCEGDFSTMVLGEESENKVEYKLTKSEQELCFRELKALQTNYVNRLYDSRKKYLEYAYKKQMKQLTLVREQALNDLNSTFSKKLKSRSKRSKRRASKKK